ncbi:MAG TPA: hypothetical protein VHG51_20425 [Longimicrobiaceae bacterium]|nr:hypothetical protein [Longimicrobiaceae bacterium]
MISGAVLDTHTMERIPGVRVEVVGIGSATTGPDGTYRVAASSASGSSVTIRAEAEGYVPAALAVDIGRRPLEVPALLLTPVGPPVTIGPGGGVVPATTGVTLHVPAGAVRALTPITATRLPQVSGQPIQTRDPIRALATVHLGPAGIHFAKPVTVTVGLLTRARQGSRLRVLTLDHKTLAWNSTGWASVSDDGWSATFSTTSTSLNTLALEDGRRIVYTISDEITSSGEVPGTRQVIANCLQGETIVSAPSETYSTELSLSIGGDFQPIQVEVTSSIGYSLTLSSVQFTIPQGAREKITVWQVRDTHEGWVVAAMQEQVNGGWVNTGETGQWKLFYRTRRWDATREPCHDQGGSGG